MDKMPKNNKVNKKWVGTLSYEFIRIKLRSVEIISSLHNSIVLL